MPVTLFLSSTLRRHLPDYDPMEGAALEMEMPMTVRELCQAIHIPVEEIKLVMVDGRGESLDYALRGDERLSLFPAVGGG